MSSRHRRQQASRERRPRVSVGRRAGARSRRWRSAVSSSRAAIERRAWRYRSPARPGPRAHPRQIRARPRRCSRTRVRRSRTWDCGQRSESRGLSRCGLMPIDCMAKAGPDRSRQDCAPPRRAGAGDGITRHHRGRLLATREQPSAAGRGNACAAASRGAVEEPGRPLRLGAKRNGIP